MTTPLTNEARAKLISQAVSAATQVDGERRSIKWKSGAIVLPVVEIPLSAVLLNPHSHRIRAQLESLPVDQRREVDENKFTPEAQAIISQLLRETEGYQRIANALQRDGGQREPGVLTTAGVLVNANTRAVVLRAMRVDYIRVVVLPGDALDKEITDLELHLQMEQDVKQEYSFTNELLFIEELMTQAGRTAQEVGMTLRPDLSNTPADRKRAADDIARQMRLLGLIRDVIETSGGRLRLIDFDQKRQALIEIDQDYQSMSPTRPDEAMRVREAQLAGFMVDLDYRKLREVDSKLLDGYLVPALEEEPSLRNHVGAITAASMPAAGGEDLAGLDLLDDLGDSEKDREATAPSLSGIYRLLARTPADEDVTLPAADGDEPVTLPCQAVAAGLESALQIAIENKKRDKGRQDALTAPMQYLRDAARALDRASAAYDEVADAHGFDRSAFGKAVSEMTRAYDAFIHAIGPGIYG